MKDEKKLQAKLTIRTTTDKDYTEYVEDLKLAQEIAEDIIECGYTLFYNENDKEQFKCYSPNSIVQVNAEEIEDKSE